MIRYMHRKLNIDRLFFCLLVFVPVSAILHFLAVSESIQFVIAVLSIVPLAHFIGKATESISLLTNPTVGGFVNATFGNIVELIIAIFAINVGLVDVVKASIIGSIISNILLLIGLSMFFGGLRFKEQVFNTQAAGVSSTMLIIAVVGLSIPTLYTQTHENVVVLPLSEIVSIVLALIYLLGLLFSFSTHKHLFDPVEEFHRHHVKIHYSARKAGAILFVSLLAVLFESNLLVSTIEHASVALGINKLFIGMVIIPIVANVAEKIAAITMALKNHIDLSIEIGTSSAIQIALFVTPILVFFSQFLNTSFTLVFPIFKLITMLFAVMIVNYLSSDGRCNWLEGAQLITVYLIIAITFYF